MESPIDLTLPGRKFAELNRLAQHKGNEYISFQKKMRRIQIKMNVHFEEANAKKKMYEMEQLFGNLGFVIFFKQLELSKLQKIMKIEGNFVNNPDFVQTKYEIAATKRSLQDNIDMINLLEQLQMKRNEIIDVCILYIINIINRNSKQKWQQSQILQQQKIDSPYICIKRQGRITWRDTNSIFLREKHGVSV